jgi:general secretion pathway protein D
MMKSTKLIRQIVALSLSICLVLPGAVDAAGKKGKKNFNAGVKYSAQQQWDLAAQEFALAVAADPDNAEYRANYVRSLMQASMMFAKRGDALAEQNDYASAFSAYRQAFAYDATNEVAKVKMQRMIDMQKVAAGGGEAISFNAHTGNIQQTSGDVRIAYRPRVGEVQKKIEIKQLSLKSSVASIGKTLGLNMIFDESVKDAPFSIDLQDVSFARALDLIFLQNKLTFEVVDRKTLFIYADNPTNKQRFERFMIKTFYLNNTKHDVVRTALQTFIGAAGGGRIVISIDTLNAVLVRATAGELQMLQEIINGIDKNRAEVVIDVNIYEISRTDALQLGNQVALTPQQVSETKFDTQGQPVTVQTGQSTSLQNLGGLGQAGVAMLAGSTFVPFLAGIGTLFGMPPTGVSMLQAQGRSRLLYSSQVHALDGQQNQTKLGQSVPVRTGTNYGYGGGAAVITTGGNQSGQAAANPNAVGFNSGLFDNIQYKDVGLVIDVVPTITNEGYVEIKMKLESSSVEDSGETANLTPTFAQRSLSTTARVMDGVTAVVGGVRQDNKGTARATVPFVGMVPILGRFFSTPRDASRETDLVITVTPHILRAPEIKQEDHLAQVAGPMQGGIPRSLEDVLQAVKEDEDQEKRMIAKQGPSATQSAPAGVTTINATTAVNTVSGASAAASPAPLSAPPINIQTLQTQPNNTTLQGASVQEAAFNRRGEQPATLEDPPVAAANSAAAEEAGKKAEGEKPASTEKAGEPRSEAEKLAKQMQELNQSIEAPSTPVPPAKVVAPELSDYTKERLEKIRAEELKRAKEQKAEGTAEIPEEYRNPKGPQQPVSRAVVRPANRAGAPDTTATMSVTLKSTGKPQVGKPVFVEVGGVGSTPVSGGLLVLKFDPAKLQVKSVRTGKAAGANATVIHEVSGGDLRLTLTSLEEKALTSSDTLVVVEFVPLDAGDSQIEVKIAESKMRFLTNAVAQLAAQPLKLQIVK